MSENLYKQPTMLLKVFVENPQLKDKYLDAILEHNNKLDSGDYYDSGFDMFVPTNMNFEFGKSHVIDSGIKTAAFWMNSDMTVGLPTGYYVYPRSSISKTPLRMANNVGIIDSGYRGNVKGAVDCFRGFGTAWKDCNEYQVEKFSRLFQICSPNLGPVRVILVGSIADLGSTTRGEGGFWKHRSISFLVNFL